MTPLPDAHLKALDKGTATPQAQQAAAQHIRDLERRVREAVERLDKLLAR